MADTSIPPAFEYKKPFAFPRIIGCYDTGSKNYDRIRNRASFKTAIRFIEDPSIIIKYPPHPLQIIIGIIRSKDFDLWNEADNIISPNTFGILIFDDSIVKGSGGFPSWKMCSNKIIVSTLQEAISHVPMVYLPSSIDEGVIWAKRIAYLVGITHFVSFKTSTDGLFINPNDILKNNMVELDEDNESDMNEAFPEIVWISNILKTKNYDDRRMILQNMTKMIHTPIESRWIDRFFLIGNLDFINEERFRYVNDIQKCTPTTFKNLDKNENGMTSIKKMLDYVYENTNQGTIIFLMRQEATEMPFSVFRSVTRMIPKTIASIIPFVIPDVPDPKPELFHRGDPRITAGYLMRRDLNPDSKIISERLSECTLYTHNHYSVIPTEFLKNHFIIGNGTRQIAVGFPQIKTIILVKPISSTPSDIVCTEVAPIGLQSVDSVRKIPNILFKGEYLEPILVNPLKAFEDNKPLEIRTYLNMTNKSLRRSSKEDVEIKDTPTSISVKYPIQLIDGNNYRIRRDHWTYSQISQSYWGVGTASRETGFIHKSIVLSDTVYVPLLHNSSDNQSKEYVLSFINHLSTSKYIIKMIDEGLLPKQITFESSKDNIPLYEKYMEAVLGNKKKDIKIQIVDSGLVNIFGGDKTYISSYPNEMKNYGFIPHLVRIANQNIIKESDKGKESDESVESKQDNPITGLIIGDKWNVVLLKILKEAYPKISWKYIKTLMDASPLDFMNAKYVIGSQTTNAWAGLIFTNPAYCNIIEIEYEHDASLCMYHFGKSIGLNYQILPLKNEPISRCEKRIRENILKYVVE